jgi:hypothetical protein
MHFSINELKTEKIIDEDFFLRQENEDIVWIYSSIDYSI